MLHDDNYDLMETQENNKNIKHICDDESRNEPAPQKPLPIYIPDVIDINKMISNISTTISKDEFSY